MSGRLPRAGKLYSLIALACGAAIGVALFAQYRLNMQPCPWCVLQRLIFIVIGLMALFAAFGGGRMLRLVSSVLMALLAAGGVAAALWQHYVAAQSQSCNLTWADRIVGGLRLDVTLPSVFEVRASCADAAVKLLGLSFDFWSLGLFAVLGVMAIAAMRSR